MTPSLKEAQMVANTPIAVKAKARTVRFRPELLRVFDRLPLPQQKEVLNFARFLQQQTAVEEPLSPTPQPQVQLRTAPATTLAALTSLVRLGGDALADTEALYDNDTGRN
jgi:hypothetical protein